MRRCQRRQDSGSTQRRGCQVLVERCEAAAASAGAGIMLFNRNFIGRRFARGECLQTRIHEDSVRSGENGDTRAQSDGGTEVRLRFPPTHPSRSHSAPPPRERDHGGNAIMVA